jgi:hypothetical protein
VNIVMNLSSSIKGRKFFTLCSMELLVGNYENDKEPLGSIKGKEFHDQLNDYQLLKKDSAPRSLV